MGLIGEIRIIHCHQLLSTLVCCQVLFRHSLQGDVAHYPLQSVLAFLEQNKLGKYRDIFQESGMDGDFLLEADDTVLKELGVNSALDRKKIKTKYKTFVNGQH